MSVNKKIVTTYCKALFENVKKLPKTKKESELVTPPLQSDPSAVLTPAEKKIQDFFPVFVIGEELYLIRTFLTFSNTFKNIFNNPTLPEKEKLEIILMIFPGTTALTRSFLKILTERSHLYLIPEISDAYNAILLKFNNTTRVRLITPSILEESFGVLLLNTLKKLTKSEEVILQVTYNPQLLGGLILEYNSKSLDASLLKEFSLFVNEI
jgi:ATP synthase F1 delta subunit